MSKFSVNDCIKPYASQMPKPQIIEYQQFTKQLQKHGCDISNFGDFRSEIQIICAPNSAGNAGRPAAKMHREF